jgi:large subunit ribosomal protein L17
VLQEAIVTTVAKAKEIRPVVEKLVTMSMDNSLNSKRVIASRVGLEVAKKLHDTFAKRYEDRKGGYTRITRLGRVGKRVGEQARIEFVK